MTSTYKSGRKPILAGHGPAESGWKLRPRVARETYLPGIPVSWAEPLAPQGRNINRRGRESPFPRHSAHPSPGGAALHKQQDITTRTACAIPARLTSAANVSGEHRGALPHPIGSRGQRTGCPPARSNRTCGTTAYGSRQLARTGRGVELMPLVLLLQIDYA